MYKRQIQHRKDLREPRLTGAHVELEHTRLAGEHAPQTGLAGDALDLVPAGQGGAVVGDGYLTDPQYLVNDNDVPAGVGENGVCLLYTSRCV